jgi:hypothetical protein
MRMLQRFIHGTGRVLRALFALALMAGALAIGLLVATAVLARLAWRRSRSRAAPTAFGRRPRGTAGEVIDAEVREVGIREVRYTASNRPAG